MFSNGALPGLEMKLSVELLSRAQGLTPVPPKNKNKNK